MDNDNVVPIKPPPKAPTLKQLREQAQRNRDQGLQRNGRLYKRPQPEVQA